MKNIFSFSCVNWSDICSQEVDCGKNAWNLQLRLVLSSVCQVAEGRRRSSSRADTADGQAAAASSEAPGGRSDSENRPAVQNLEQDALTCQQDATRKQAATTGGAAEAAGTAAAGGESASVSSLSGSGDGEEKRDQTKEEPPLELRQQEGWWRRFLGMVWFLTFF